MSARENDVEQKTGDRGTPKTRNAAQTRADILRVATTEFAAHGLAGSRIDEIASLTRTTKRMIYYYFESKEGLYLAAMESAYTVIRELERELEIDHLEPVAALRALAEATYDHHTSHRDFVRLVAIENVHRAEIISQSEVIPDLNATAVATAERVLHRGVEAGLFRDDVDALDLHMIISSYAVFHVANRYTFRTLFGRDLLEPARHEHYRRLAGDLAVSTISRPTGGDANRP
ncbi:TetR family transcriptional regulator [Leucobacter allii]|uniref:TetR family transcriptional regulator n=1 Tax=Leucobacter allii TaxID=2932247 RepID=A0ABY4FMK3_9MICO|nr:TetR family transcriptional regulator [Leucobacter allii]UOQ57499.1 TetR family transcriptional regulator [Leucobacter allii]UOR01959.1 TetR family transcriptional regulator [Leucobacter allii]